MQHKKLVIIDEYIKNKSGHYYSYNKSTFEAFTKHNYTCKLYGNTQLLDDIATELNGIKYFSFTTMPWYRKIPILGAILYRIYLWNSVRKQIEDALSEELEPNTQIFFPNLFWYNALPYAGALKKVQQPTTVLLRLSINEFFQEPPLFRPLIKKLVHAQMRKLARNKFVYVVSDSEVISAEFNKLNLGKTCTTLPIPHVEDAAVEVHKKDDYFNLYLPGVMRLEKGAEFVLKALKCFCEKYSDVAPNIKLTTQFFGDGEKAQLDVIKSQLLQLPIKNEILGSLSTTEYKATFQKADCVLIVYNPDCGYRFRTSGILAEAIAAEKPFITCTDSWMSLQANKFGIGQAVEYDNDSQLASTILQLMNTLETEANKVAQGKKAWLAFHSKQNFYEVFNNCSK
jgi:hypothetical protein